MASNVQISIKDNDSATKWRDMVTDINTDYHNAMKDAAQTLIDMDEFADGTLVDEFVKYGNDLLNAANNTFDAVKAIADTVNTILSTVTNFVDTAVSGIGSLVKNVLG